MVCVLPNHHTLALHLMFIFSPLHKYTLMPCFSPRILLSPSSLPAFPMENCNCMPEISVYNSVDNTNS